MRGSFMALGIAAAAVLTCWAGSSSAQTPTAPLIAGYGRTAPVEHAGVRPDPSLDYKVVVNVTEAGGPDRPPMGLEKAARLANLLAESGVPADRRHIVVIISGPATAAVLTEAAMKARGKGTNPSADLISKLNAAGVGVHVCGQALAGAKIARSEVLPEVQVDLSALTTLSTLQLQGYALVPD